MLTLDPRKVTHLIRRMRRVGARPGGPAPDRRAALDAPCDGLEECPGDGIHGELLAFINGMNADEQIELVALTWIGRGNYVREEWGEAVRMARKAHSPLAAAYLLEMPLLGDYLADGLAEVLVGAPSDGDRDRHAMAALVPVGRP